MQVEYDEALADGIDLHENIVKLGELYELAYDGLIHFNQQWFEMQKT